jgi:hypothetical protein
MPAAPVVFYCLVIHLFVSPVSACWPGVQRTCVLCNPCQMPSRIAFWQKLPLNNSTLTPEKQVNKKKVAEKYYKLGKVLFLAVLGSKI